MGAFLVPVVLLVVVLLVAAVALKRFGRAEIEHSDRLQAVDRPTVRYEVPTGQDPAIVLTELRQAGYDASADSEPGPSSPIIIIGTTHGGAPDRDRLRDVLAHASMNVDPALDSSSETTSSTVRFQDE
jgi:hypothetical protein